MDQNTKQVMERLLECKKEIRLPVPDPIESRNLNSSEKQFLAQQIMKMDSDAMKGFAA